MSMWPSLAQQSLKCIPCLGLLGSAFDHDVIDEPAFETPAPGPDVDFDAILLDVGAGRQKQAAARDRADLPRLAALIEALPVRRLAGLDPRLAEHAVLEAALGLVGGRRFPEPSNVLPGEPPDRRIERRDVKPDRAGVLGLRGRTPLARLEHGGLVMFFDPAVTGCALII